jgi:hypothetical protein
VTELKIEQGKEYLLRNGWRMRCYATYVGSGHFIHGAYKSVDGDWVVMAWSKDGGYQTTEGPDRLDIISEAPKTIEVDCWVWVYGDRVERMYCEWFERPDVDKPIAQFHIQRSVTVGEGM